MKVSILLPQIMVFTAFIFNLFIIILLSDSASSSFKMPYSHASQGYLAETKNDIDESCLKAKNKVISFYFKLSCLSFTMK